MSPEPSSRMAGLFLHRRAHEIPLDGPEHTPEEHRHGEINAGDDEIDLEEAEGARLDVAGRRRQFGRGDGRTDAGIEQQQDELAGQRRIDRLDGRLQDDEAEDLQGPEAERLAGLDLSGADALDAGPDDLDAIGAD